MKIALLFILTFFSILQAEAEQAAENPHVWEINSFKDKSDESIWILAMIQEVSVNVWGNPQTFRDAENFRKFVKELPEGTTIIYGVEGLPKELYIGQDVLDAHKLREEFLEMGIKLRPRPGF